MVAVFQRPVCFQKSVSFPMLLPQPRTPLLHTTLVWSAIFSVKHIPFSVFPLIFPSAWNTSLRCSYVCFPHSSKVFAQMLLFHYGLLFLYLKLKLHIPLLALSNPFLDFVFSRALTIF